MADIDAPVLQVPGLEEVNLFSFRHDVYPLIDPTTHFTTQSFSGKVVLITGGSVGIGATTAQFYARAGASLVLVARGAERLEQCKVDIQKLVPKAKVETVVGDISEPETGRLAVRVAVERFGRVDVVIANQFVQVRTVGKFTDLGPYGGQTGVKLNRQRFDRARSSRENLTARAAIQRVLPRQALHRDFRLTSTDRSNRRDTGTYVPYGEVHRGRLAETGGGDGEWVVAVVGKTV